MKEKVATLARHAMATRFEFVLCGDDEGFLRSAGEEALDEIERIEAQLSYFRADSELTDINRNAARRPVKVDPRVFRLLHRCKQLSELTDGAFDITVDPLLKLWGFRESSPTLQDGALRPEHRSAGSAPTPDDIESTVRLVVSRQIELDEDHFTVCFQREGLTIDLGAVGKGYAIDRAAAMIRERGIASALLHGGTSSVSAIGTPPDGEYWKVAIANPFASFTNPSTSLRTGSPTRQLANSPTHKPTNPVAIAHLRDASLSVSAQHGRSVIINGKRLGHTIDPRTGYPVEGALLAAVVCQSATDADALSTALLTLGESGLGQYETLYCDALVGIETEADTLRVAGEGMFSL